MMDVMRALGVDVSANRGLDLVLLDEARSVRSVWSRKMPAELHDILADVQPDVVAIDSPPRFGKGRSRLAERELNVRGIKVYYTPSTEIASGNDFYSWMLIGHKAFEAAAIAGYPLYVDGPTVDRHAIEVFPHATAVTLAGILPPTGSSASATKRAWRMSVLQRNDVDTATLRTLDAVDAALAALTAVMAFEGCFVGVGDPTEGVIVLPCRELPVRYERDLTEPRRSRREELVAEVGLLRLEAWADTLRVVSQHVEAGTSVPPHVARELRAVQDDIEARGVGSSDHDLSEG